MLAGLAKHTRVGMIYWLMPTLVFLVGLTAIVKPDWMSTAPLFVIGWTMILYGIVECINAFKIMNMRRQLARQAQSGAPVDAAAIEVQTGEEMPQEPAD